MKNNYKKNQQILQYCPNYYKINAFEYYEDDYVTERLIKVYQEFVLSVALDNKEQLNKLKMIDKIMNKYIDDYNFRNELKKGLMNVKVKKDAKNLLEHLVNSIIELSENYETTFTRTIYIARWI
jgi:hypothetical protein